MLIKPIHICSFFNVKFMRELIHVCSKFEFRRYFKNDEINMTYFSLIPDNNQFNTFVFELKIGDSELRYFSK